MAISLQDLARLPPDTQEPIRKYAENLFASLAENMRSFAVFGSATGAEYVPGRSDVNLLIGVRILGVESLRAARPPATRRLGRPFLAPLMLTRDYIQSSLDTFPVEFLEMKERQLLLYGEDFLAGITVNPADIRRECERELRSHLIRLRQGYLEAGRSQRDLERLLHAALSSLVPILRQLLRLKDPASPAERGAVIAAVATAFGVNAEPMIAIERDRAGVAGIDGHAVDSVFDQFQRELEKLTRAVDRM